MENIENKILYEQYQQQHLSENGTAPKAFAITELIKKAIEDKSYIVYKGGGYYPDGSEVKKYDVLVWFTWGRDPEFMVCLDNSEGDSCDLYNCNKNGNLMYICK